MDTSSPAGPAPHPDAHAPPTVPVRLAVAAGPAAALGVCFWSMILTPLTGPPPISAAVAGVLSAAAAVSLTASLRRGVPARIILLAATMATAVALPAISAVVHRFPDISITPVAMGLSVAAVAAAAPTLTPPVVRRIVWAVLAAVVWLSLAGGGYALFAPDSAFLYQRGGRSWIGVLQLSGIPGHPNGMALFAALALVLQLLSLGAVLRRPLRQRAILLVVGPVASGAALLWSQSRTGLLATALVAVVVLGLRAARSGRRTTAAVLWVTAAASVIPPAITLVGVAWSFHGRWLPWRIAWTLLEDNWILGVGPGAFSPQFWDFWTALQPASWEPAHAHNQVLQSTVLLGLVGGAILIATAAAMIRIAAAAGPGDRSWAVAVCTITFVTAGPETVLGVGDIAATYLPILVGAAVLSSSALLAGRIAAPDRKEREAAAVAGSPNGLESATSRTRTRTLG